jgi:hypothetical protein
MSPDAKDIILVGIPTIIPTLTVLTGILINNSRLSDFRTEMNTRFDSMEKLFDEKSRHMEDVIDARLKHLEQERD